MKKAFIPLLLGLVLVGCSNDEPKQDTPDPVTPDDPAIPATPDDPVDSPGFADSDYSPAQVTIYVKDADGDDLFSDAYNGTLDRKNLPAMVSYTYDGETKPLAECGRRPDEAKTPQSRYYMPTFYGVYVDYTSQYLVNPGIHFGEFDGTKDQHEKVTVNWPDGTHSTIEFTSEDHDPFSSMKVRLDDGEWENTTRVTIVK